MRDDLLQKVQQTIDRHRMLAVGETIILAVSGGVDSMVLLSLFLRLRARYSASLHVAHLDHGLRGTESADAAVFVRRQCEAFQVPVTLTRVEGNALWERQGGSLEAAARDLRYRFLERVADEQGATRIALGHHRDDQAETILMNLLRGSGARGFGGIPTVLGRIIRPLIERFREEIERYARSQGIPYVEDSSNRSLSYLRNRIRLELLPELAKRYNPRVADALASAASIFEAEDGLLSAMTEEQLSAVVVSRSSQEVVLRVSRMAALPAALRRRVIRHSAHLLRGDRPGLTFQQTLALERLLLGESGRGEVHAAGGIRAARAGDRMILSAREHEAKGRREPFHLAVPCRTTIPGFSLSLQAGILEDWRGDQLVEDPWTALLDADRAGRELLVRSWEPGDRFIPLGMTGHKKLQDFFVDTKVPRHQRCRVPLVVSGGEIAWVVGFRVDERFKVTDSTRRILRMCAARGGAE
ncbi:MAG: tRNA lysidine(34) synthetase TilS [candidate division NC10 bacterium]|nr:tRNA lysidine(34) synthetase TilS [candidate division NC10 bacterium]